MCPCPILTCSLDTAPGTKVLLKNPEFYNGRLLLRQNAIKVLHKENLEDPKIKAVLGNDWLKAKMLAELAEQYDNCLRQGFLGQGHTCHARLEVRPERGKGLYGR